MTTPVAELIRDRLTDLQYQSLEILDDSARHRGHEGAKNGGGHYHLIIESNTLQALSRLAAHREIYRRLDDLIPLPIHALQITLRRP